MNSSNRPLPAPPGQYSQQRPAQQRPRAKSGFSFHSRTSSGSGQKVDLHETHEEKEAKRLQTKADPSMAITEAEPCEYSLNAFSDSLDETETDHLQLRLHYREHHWHLFEQFNIGITKEIQLVCLLHPCSQYSSLLIFLSKQPTQIDRILHEADGRDLLIQFDLSKRL
jgi:hypothetical protein